MTFWVISKNNDSKEINDFIEVNMDVCCTVFSLKNLECNYYLEAFLVIVEYQEGKII